LSAGTAFEYDNKEFYSSLPPSIALWPPGERS
jgi:hypothetical protein